jgi:hypothetical protein
MRVLRNPVMWTQAIQLLKTVGAAVLASPAVGDARARCACCGGGIAADARTTCSGLVAAEHFRADHFTSRYVTTEARGRTEIVVAWAPGRITGTSDVF